MFVLTGPAGRESTTKQYQFGAKSRSIALNIGVDAWAILATPFVPTSSFPAEQPKMPKVAPALARPLTTPATRAPPPKSGEAG